MSDSESHYDYTPSLPAAIIMTIAFGCLTILNSIQVIRRRAFFCIPFVLGGIRKSSTFFKTDHDI